MWRFNVIFTYLLFLYVSIFCAKHRREDKTNVALLIHKIKKKKNNNIARNVYKIVIFCQN